ncbi:MAG: tRNA pseudouridine(55) synthase TruB [Lachnospiraceae bacterium]
MINGILNVYKEAGFTSHDVVAKLRGICKQKKIGHTGTLDPDATGVLPVCLGSATKLCDLLTDKSKEYEAEFLLGVTTDTQDISGTRLTEAEVKVTTDQIQQTVQSFVGGYEQLPPMYSAIKVGGKHLYELARQGQVIERATRHVDITDITIMSLNLPYIKLRVACSKGTYIRTLGYDIGMQLGCGATMTSLIRTRVGEFKVTEALTLAQIAAKIADGTLLETLTTVDSVFAEYRAATVSPAYRRFIDNGNSLLPEHLQETLAFMPSEPMRIYNDSGAFCGIYAYDNERNILKPIKIFPID